MDTFEQNSNYIIYNCINVMCFDYSYDGFMDL